MSWIKTKQGEFDGFYEVTYDGYPALPQGVGESGMLLGDKGWVQSYPDIQDNRTWLGENVIKLNDCNYWAFPFSGNAGFPWIQSNPNWKRLLGGLEPSGF